MFREHNLQPPRIRRVWIDIASNWSFLHTFKNALADPPYRTSRHGRPPWNRRYMNQLHHHAPLDRRLSFPHILLPVRGVPDKSGWIPIKFVSHFSWLYVSLFPVYKIHDHLDKDIHLIHSAFCDQQSQCDEGTIGNSLGAIRAVEDAVVLQKPKE